MMNWARTISNQGPFPLGRYFGAFLTLTFDATACGPAGSTIAGTTYDPTNLYTTSPHWSNVAGANLKDVCGFTDIAQIHCMEDSSSSTGKASAANTDSGVIRCSWDSVSRAIFLVMDGNATADAALTADPATMRPEASMDTTAGALASVSFRFLVIGR